MQQKQRGQALLAIQRVKRTIDHIAKNKIKVQGLITVQCCAKVGNKAGAHQSGLLTVTPLSVIALEQRNFDGLHLHAVNHLAEQLRQTGQGAVAWVSAVRGLGDVGCGHCR